VVKERRKSGRLSLGLEDKQHRLSAEVLGVDGLERDMVLEAGLSLQLAGRNSNRSLVAAE
jgi:hypothetical protein